MLTPRVRPDFSSSLYPARLGRITSISQLYGCNDGSIVALINTENGGVLLRSPTHSSPAWTVVQTFDYYIGYGSLARGNGLDTIFVSLPASTPGKWQYWQSKDHGQTWLSYSNPNIGFAPIVAADQSLIVFGTDGKISESLDGSMWTRHDNGITANIQDAWYSPNLKSIVLATDSKIYSSRDGNFNGPDASARSNPHLQSLFEFGSGSNAYFAGVDAFGNVSLSRVAGGPWTTYRKAPESGYAYSAYGLAYAEDQDVWVISIHQTMHFFQTVAFYYASGSHGKWKEATPVVSELDQAAASKIVYAKKRFVAIVTVEYDSNSIYTSTNGSVWTLNPDVTIVDTSCDLRVDGPPSDQYFFIFCAYARPALFSQDGLNWKKLVMPEGIRYVNYVPGSNLWLATGYDSFYTTVDLVNYSDKKPNPYGLSLFNRVVENGSNGAVAAISTFDNSIITTAGL
eukprot:TRINITY_DN2668_c0_g1_i1.p2 TRINITY_DN2668_c0_g1~~TRINITY_DN2668_c0_g1_i1.p2  ORF type:complete len:455 (-),score=83.91 TRINITY_DN2668_c0_g1_i1:1783-3147(-)